MYFSWWIHSVNTSSISALSITTTGSGLLKPLRKYFYCKRRLIILQPQNDERRYMECVLSVFECNVFTLCTESSTLCLNIITNYFVTWSRRFHLKKTMDMLYPSANTLFPNHETTIISNNITKYLIIITEINLPVSPYVISSCIEMSMLHGINIIELKLINSLKSVFKKKENNNNTFLFSRFQKRTTNYIFTTQYFLVHLRTHT